MCSEWSSKFEWKKKKIHRIFIWSNIECQLKSKSKSKRTIATKSFISHFIPREHTDKFKVLSLVHQTQEGRVSAPDHKVLPIIGDNMVLQSLDFSANCGGVDYLPPHIGDYAPSTAALYTDLDSSVYNQGKSLRPPNTSHNDRFGLADWCLLFFFRLLLSSRANIAHGVMWQMMKYVLHRFVPFIIRVRNSFKHNRL